MDRRNDTAPTAGVKWILSAQYFIYFGVLGIYLPYFNLYCYHLDFSGFEIGTLSALRTLATALFPMLWGAVADRFDARRPIFIFCTVLSTAIWALYLTTVNFWVMFAITAVYGIFYAPIISFLESFSMDLLDVEKTRYGRLRAWGSISFILVVLAVGRIIDTFPIRMILVLILSGSVLQSLVSLKIPNTPARPRSSFSSGARGFFSKRVVIFLFCAFLMLASHGTYYGFFSIHLDRLGFDNAFIGLSWAIASMAEIVVMVLTTRIFARFSYERLLIFSFFIAAARWLILARAESAAVILFSQLFHAFSYGAFHVASILYIDSLTPKASKTFGQAVNNAVTYGMGIMTGFLFNGYLFDKIGAGNLFFISAGLAFLGGTVLLMTGMKRPKKDVIKP